MRLDEMGGRRREGAGGVGVGGRVLCSKREPTLDGVVGKSDKIYFGPSRACHILLGRVSAKNEI